MADPIEITNVGGEGVASEVTLANLLAVTEQMAKKAGIDPKDVNKKLSNLAKSTDDTIKVSTKNRDALGKNTKAVNESTGAFKKLGGLLGGAVLSSFSAIARSGTEMTRAFIAGETSLTAFASQLPLIGNQLSVLTGLFDNSFTAFQNVASSGASFNNSLTELRNTAANARMPLEEFVSLIGANSDKLASFGGTATQGAQQIARLNKALGGQRIDLLNMGLGFQEINEALIEYQYLTRAGNRGLRLSQEQERRQAEAAAAYTKNLVTLGKLTGEDVKTQQEKIARAQMDVAIQAKLATLSVEERAKMDALMADTMASGGQAAVDQLMLQFLNMPPMTEEMALYQSQFGENVNLIGNRLAQVYDDNVTAAAAAQTSTDYMVQMIGNNAAAFARLEPGLTAAAAGLDGPMATIASQLQAAGIQFTDFIDQETGRVDEERLRAAIEAAKTEADARDNATDSLATFMDTLKTVQSAFQTQVVSPLMDAVAPALNALVDAIRGPVDENGDPVGESGFMTAITKISDYINNDFAPALLEFINKFKEDPMGTIKEYFNSAISGIGNLIKDFFLGPLENTRPDGTGADVRSGGFLQETLMPIMSELGTALINGMVDGIKYLWEETSVIEAMGAGILALWAAPKIAGAMATGAASLMAKAVSSLRAPVVPAAGAGASGTAAASAAGGGRMARLLGRGARFIPGVGLAIAGGMGLYDSFTGYNADPNAGFLESMGNAGSSLLNGLSFGLLGRSSAEIAADAGVSGTPSGEGATNLSNAELATIISPTLQENIDALKTLDSSSVRSYTDAIEDLTEALSNLNEELSRDNDTMFTNRADAGELLNGISVSSQGSAQGTQQLNTTMQQIFLILQEMRDLDIRVERHTSRINGSNIAQGGVTTTGR